MQYCDQIQVGTGVYQREMDVIESSFLETDEVCHKEGKGDGLGRPGSKYRGGDRVCASNTAVPVDHLTVRARWSMKL